LSSLLFNIYSEAIFDEAILHEHIGVKVNGKFVNNLRYADDTVILTGTMAHLQRSMDSLYIACNKYGLEMNVKKTKFMLITKDRTDTDNNEFKLILNNDIIERVYSYKCLGIKIHRNGDNSREIWYRVEISRSMFIKLRKSFSNQNLPLNLKTKMLKCYVFSTFLYRMEAWTLKKADVQKI
jgi:hypothetical protein